jgi:hypothetical protein
LTFCQKLFKVFWLDVDDLVYAMHGLTLSASFRMTREIRRWKLHGCPIYLNKNATIRRAAARASNVREGFLGNRKATELTEEVFELPYRSSDGELGSVILFRTEIGGQPHDNPGWTLQERLLSARTIEFADSTASVDLSRNEARVRMH